MTVTLTVTPDPANYRVRVAAHLNLPTVDRFQLQRSTDQRTWTIVRGDQGEWQSIVGADRVTFDVELPFDSATYYRAAEQAADGSLAPWGPTAGPVTIAGLAPMWRLQDYQYPATGYWVCVQAHPSDVFAGPRGVFYAIGRADPIVTFGTRRLAAGDLTVLCESATERDVVLAFLGADEPVLIRADTVSGWGSRFLAISDLTAARADESEMTLPWLVTGQWVELRPPLATPIANYGAVWNDVPVRYATWTVMPTAFATWDELAGWTGT